MKKKAFLILVLVMSFMTVSGLAAQSISVGGGGDISYDSVTQTTVYGIFGFVDLTYLEIIAGLNIIESNTMFTIGANLKYPIPITKDITIFPTAGIEYSLYNDEGTFFINCGAGLDYAINRNMYMRVKALYVFSPENMDQGGQFAFRPSVGFRL